MAEKRHFADANRVRHTSVYRVIFLYRIFGILLQEIWFIINLVGLQYYPKQCWIC